MEGIDSRDDFKTPLVVAEFARELVETFVRLGTAVGEKYLACAKAPDVKAPWYTLEHTFVMENGTARLPRPPISGKAQGERPTIPHLEPA